MKKDFYMMLRIILTSICAAALICAPAFAGEKKSGGVLKQGGRIASPSKIMNCFNKGLYLKLIVLLVLTAIFCASAAARAAVPQLIDYQGYLMESGVAVNGSKSVTFNLFDAASGGSQLCSTGAQTVTVTKGVFSHSIGSAGCDLSTINWDNPVYLELVVQGTTLAPRERIAGAAYSVQTKAVNVIFAPSGNVSATNAQSAIEELDAEKLDKTGGTITGSLSLSGDVTAAGTVTAATFEGDGSALTNISAGTHNHDAAYVNAGGDTMTGQLTSTVATGTAPFVVASTTKVTNLNADALDGLDSTAFMAATADNWVDAGGDAMTGALDMGTNDITNAGTVTATAFSGDGSALTNIAAGTHNHDASYVNVGGDTMTGQLTSTVATGTAPFVVASTTKVTNLNADALDGLDSTAFMAATADNWVDAGGDAMTGALDMGTNDITNAGTVTATAFSGDGSALTNIAAGTHNHDASYVNVGGDTMTGQLTSTVATGTAPFVVASTTKVTNLNADALDGLDSTAFMAATADNWVDAGGDAMTGALDMGTNDITNAGTVTATDFVGDGSALTNISAGTHNHDAAYVGVGGDTMTGQLTSTVATGTAPFVVASTTKVTNLNADALDGLDSTDFMPASTDNWVDAGGDTMTGALTMNNVGLNMSGANGDIVFDNAGGSLTLAGGGITDSAGNINLKKSVRIDADADVSGVIFIDSGLANGYYSAIDFYDRGIGKWGMGKNIDNDFYVQELGTGDRLTIKNTTGYVGIGTTGPSSALQVVGTVTATAFSGDGSALTNIAAGTHNHDASYVNIGGDAMTGQLTSSVADGTAPFVVTSTTKVTNLNADMLDGNDSTAFMAASADNWVDASGDAMTGALTMNNVVINMSGANGDIVFDNAGGTMRLAGGSITDSAGSVNINDDVDINGVIQSSLPINNVVFQHAAPGRMALNNTGSTDAVISWSPSGLNLGWNVWEDGLSWQNGNGAAPSANLRVSKGTVGTDRALEFMSALSGTPEFYSRLAITYAGKVGLGTATPAYNLHLKTGDESSVIAIDSGSGSAQISEITFSDRGTAKWSILKDSANGFDITEEGVALGRLHEVM